MTECLHPYCGDKCGEEPLTELEEAALQLADEEACWYDHHGYCQPHYLHERPCPMEIINKEYKKLSETKES